MRVIASAVIFGNAADKYSFCIQKTKTINKTNDKYIWQQKKNTNSLLETKTN